ncbi:vanadium-dependent haloperoxidase [Halalkalicoccus tibetensis]|uniref:Vanadium-dependent haloperoxidase n=1 Tax=Halalkalicoccus tibetensis TaxID=175632 RepID=A0ABD5V5R9_9EURY
MSAEQDRTEEETKDGAKADISSKRRRVLGGIGAAGLASIFGIGAGSTGAAATSDGGGSDGMMDGTDRLETAYEKRMELVEKLQERGMPSMEEREKADDEDAYPSKIAMFTKGLPHADDGTPDRGAYDHLTEALDTGDPELFETIPQGGHREFIEPQGAYSVELMGPDPHSLTIKDAPPAFDSDQQVGEMIELYWQSLARDVPFREYEDSELIQAAADELEDTPGYNGPTDPKYLFHADLDGVEKGPYLSQFLLKDAPLSVHEISQDIITLKERDYVTDYDEWLANMRGQTPGPEDESGHHDGEIADSLTDHRKYMSSGRDLAACVERDMVFQPYMIAVMVLMGRPVDGVVSDPEELFGDYHPYADSDTQVGFLDFGREGIMDLVSGIGQPAHVASWVQKWLVHRRARPEEYGGLVEATVNDDIDADHPVPVEKFEEYEVFDRIYEENGSHVLTQAYPEGAPLHPAYPGGHSTVSAACSTVLKAVFNEDYVIEDPVQPTADGEELEPYEGEELTIRSELNKLASNVNYGGRQFAGVHFRSDHDAGMALGQELAIQYLEDAAMRFHDELDFDGWTFTDFDGNTVHID